MFTCLVPCEYVPADKSIIIRNHDSVDGDRSRWNTPTASRRVPSNEFVRKSLQNYIYYSLLYYLHVHVFCYFNWNYFMYKYNWTDRKAVLYTKDVVICIQCIQNTELYLRQSIYIYLNCQLGIHGRVVKVVYFKPLAPHCCGCDSRKGLFILSCKGTF
jgi:hypothetical protein